MSGFWAALQFLTRLPVPTGEGERLEGSLAWLPLVGLLLGAILAAADHACQALQLSPLVTSTLLVVLLLALTGALHVDGLADACDALFSHATPERRLEIMRDPHPGAFGVVGVVSVILLKVAAVSALPLTLRTAALLLAPTLGRWAIVLLVAAFPYGRQHGLGLPLKLGARPRTILLASALPVVAAAALWPVGPPLAVLAAASAWLIGRWMLRQLPGLTGDCYGAGCELVETLVLLSAPPLARLLG